MKRLLVTVFSLVLLVITTRCGKDESASSNTLAAAAPTLGITSPTAGSSSSSASLFGSKSVFQAMLNAPGLIAIFKFFGLNGKNSFAAESTAPTDVVPYDTMVTALKEKFTADPTTSAEGVDLKMASAKLYQAPCFGPSFSEDLANDGSANLQAGVDHLSGDVGIALAVSDSGKTQACAAAQLNALVGGQSARFAREALELLAVMLAKANKDGKSLPAISDAPVEVTLPAISGVTITSSTLDRLADDANGKPVYKSVILGTETASAKSISITFYHTPTADDNSTYKGLMQAVVPHQQNSSYFHRGITMLYNKTGTETVFILESGANRNTDSTDFFSATTGRYDFSKSAFGEDGVRFHASIDNATQAWKVNYAWQAGQSDGHVRSFAVATTGTGSGATGKAYYSFGGDISTLTDTNFYSAGMTGMFCNWSGVGQGTQTANKAQKQTMSWSTSAGEFQPVTNNITTAPSNNCSSNTSFSYANPSNPPGATKPSYLTNPTAAVTNDLVNTANISSDIGSVTVPTFTMP